MNGRKVKFGTIEIIAAICGAIAFLGIDWAERSLISSGMIPEEIYSWCQFGGIAFAGVSAVFGALTGMISGVGGMMLDDVLFAGHVNYSHLIGTAVYCYLLGRYSSRFGIAEGNFNMRSVADFNVVNVFAVTIGSLMVMPMFSFLIYDVNLLEIVTTGAKSALGNAVFTGIVCSAILLLVSRIIKRRKS